jgi:hypothetical protein
VNKNLDSMKMLHGMYVEITFILFSFAFHTTVRAHARSTLISGIRSNEHNFDKYCTLSSKTDKIVSELDAPQ